MIYITSFLLFISIVSDVCRSNDKIFEDYKNNFYIFFSLKVVTILSIFYIFITTTIAFLEFQIVLNTSYEIQELNYKIISIEEEFEDKFYNEYFDNIKDTYILQYKKHVENINNISFSLLFFKALKEDDYVLNQVENQVESDQ